MGGHARRNLSADQHANKQPHHGVPQTKAQNMDGKTPSSGLKIGGGVTRLIGKS